MNADKNDPRKVSMWKDLNGNAWDTPEECRRSNDNILKTREHNRRVRIFTIHVDKAFDDWLKYTDHEKACDMRSGAVKMFWYLNENSLLAGDIFDE